MVRTQTEFFQLGLENYNIKIDGKIVQFSINLIKKHIQMINVIYVLPLGWERKDKYSSDLSKMVSNVPEPRLQDSTEIKVFLRSTTNQTNAHACKSGSFLFIEIDTRNSWDDTDPIKQFGIDHDPNSIPICVIIFEDEHECVVNGHRIIVIFDNHALILIHRFGKIERCEIYHNPSVSMMVSGSFHQARLVIECYDEVKGHEETILDPNILNIIDVFSSRYPDDHCVLHFSKIELFRKEHFYGLTTIFSIKFPRIFNVEIGEYTQSSIIIHFTNNESDKSSRFSIVLFSEKNDDFDDEEIDGSPFFVLKRINTITVKKTDESEGLIDRRFEVVATMCVCPNMVFDDNSEQDLDLFITALLELNKLSELPDFSDSD
jgi:hypothetical protein